MSNWQWAPVASFRLTGKEASVEIAHGEADGLINITLYIGENQIVRKSTCSIDYLIERIFGATAPPSSAI